MAVMILSLQYFMNQSCYAGIVVTLPSTDIGAGLSIEGVNSL